MTDPTASLRDRIADVVIPLLLDTLPKVIARSRGYEVADTVLGVLPPPADRAAVLREAADRIDATREPFPIAVQNGITWATAELRRMAAEAQPVCVECGHPQAVHREGDDPVTPGTCSACSEDDDRHDYAPATGARQDGA